MYVPIRGTSFQDRRHAENRRRGQGKTLPHKRTRSVYGMKDSQETMTKVINRLMDP